MNKTQVREFIIRKTLQDLDIPWMWSANAEELLMGTAAQESGLFTYVRQVGCSDDSTNPMGGYGPFQMENATYMDIYNRMIKDKPLEETIVAGLGLRAFPGVGRLMTDLALAVIMCRLKYLSIEEKLPVAANIPAMAAYWKKYYNTPEGKGTEQEFIDNYNRYVIGNG